VARCFRAGIVAALLSAAPNAHAQRLTVEQLNGGAVDPFAASPGTRATVFLFTSTECPISNRYAPELRRIVGAFAARGVAFRLVYPDPSDGQTQIREHMTAFGLAGTVEALRDPRHALVKRVKASVTPEAAVVVDGVLKYRGRIDDRYVELGIERPAPTTHDLADALTAVLAGRPVDPPTTQAVGCFIADFSR
jgi:hypothetical protein